MTTTTNNQTLSRSPDLYDRALKVLPGGASRITVLRKPQPLYAQYGEGCRITDADGITRIDFANNMAALIHGHAHAPVVDAVTSQIRRGTAFSMATEIEIRYAEHMCSRNEGFEQIRFMNSGTEAVMAGIKAARAFTSRTKIAKIEGAYHGGYDFAEVSQAANPKNWGAATSPNSVALANGTPPSVLDDVIVLPFNDTETAISILNEHAGELACVLLDLMPHRVGLIPARQEFVDALRRWTNVDGALLVCDEVITFRGAYGGFQETYNLRPDLTAMGKVVGGGFPVGALAGPQDVMSVMDPTNEPVLLPNSGTFSANPVTMAAGLATMESFDSTSVAKLNQLNSLAVDGLQQIIHDRGVEASVTGAGSMFRIHLREDAPDNYRESFPDTATIQRRKRFLDALLDEGVLLISSGTGALSTAMGEAEIEHLIQATDRALVCSASSA